MRLAVCAPRAKMVNTRCLQGQNAGTQAYILPGARTRGVPPILSRSTFWARAHPGSAAEHSSV